MNGFRTKLRIELKGEQLFVLTALLHYSNKDFDIFINEGFDFDGASIPRIMWSIYGCPFGGLYTLAACLHDALYASKIFDRKTCDKLFYEAMIASGVEKNTALEMYLAVRAGGQSAYDDSEKLQKYRNFIEIKSKGGLW